MQEVSLRQVIDYAIALEEESYRFYRKAMRITANEELQKLAENLATLELDQANKLRSILGTKSVKAAELDKMLMVDDNLMPELTHSTLVQKDELDKDILREALERDLVSQKIYQVVGGTEGLNSAILAACQECAGQEAEHLVMIKEPLAALA